MIAVKQDEDNKVVAYVDYYIVDKFGYPCEVGQYCYVKKCWVHESIRYEYTLKNFVEEEHIKFPTVKWIYYEREKYNKRMSIYDITRFYTKRRI